MKWNEKFRSSPRPFQQRKYYCVIGSKDVCFVLKDLVSPNDKKDRLHTWDRNFHNPYETIAQGAK